MAQCKYTNVYREEEGKWSQALLGGAQLMDKRRWAQVEIKTFKHKKNLSYWAWSNTGAVSRNSTESPP